MRCIKNFSSKSSLITNLSKSLIFCSPNTSYRMKKQIGDLAGIPITDNLGRYLGIPILHERVSKSTFSYTLENMKCKLASWKMESLGMAGWQVLVKSTLASIPVYTIQALALPKKTYDDIA